MTNGTRNERDMEPAEFTAAEEEYLRSSCSVERSKELARKLGLPEDRWYAIQSYLSDAYWQGEAAGQRRVFSDLERAGLAITSAARRQP